MMAGRFALDFDETSSPLSSGIDQTPPFTQRKPLFSLPPSFNPSSTPAGPPPSQRSHFSDRQTHFSTTPAGPPPSSIYGSSAVGGRKLQFQPSAESPSFEHTQNLHGAALSSRTINNTPARPKSNSKVGSSNVVRSAKAMPSSSRAFRNSGDVDESPMSMDGRAHDEDVPSFRTSATHNIFDTSIPSHHATFKSSIVPPSRHPPRKKVAVPKVSELPRTGNEGIIPGIARNLASQYGGASLEEADELIIYTEKSMQGLMAQRKKSLQAESVTEQTTETVSDLIIFWRKFIYSDTPAPSTAGIGPSDNASGFEKANYIASLLLFLHNRPALGESVSMQANQKSLVPSQGQRAPIPLILLEWLDNYHTSYKAQFKAILSNNPNCTAHEYFWDVVRCLILRGKLREVIRLFEEADFKYAASARDDGAEMPGYHGPQLQAVHSVVNRARQILVGCPSQEGNWETRDDDWDLYRKRIVAEIDHIAELAETDMDDDEGNDFIADNFGRRRTGESLMRSMRGSASRLPTAVYESLKGMYNILLGSSEEILEQSQDWLEAAAALTIWWDGSEPDDIATWSTNVGRSNVIDNAVADDPYLSRLSAAFLCVTDPDDAKSLQINTLSIVEVGLAAVLQGDYSSALRILQTMSLPIASVVAETGTSSGWLNLGDGNHDVLLDQDDLMVLSYASPSGISKDDVLSEYAEALFDRPDFQDSEGKTIEGWELALSVASRFDSASLIKSTTSEFLDRLDLDSQERMDKLVGLCSALGLDEEAHRVCEKFADHLVNNTTDYGTALLCYARSHASNKLRQLMDLLVSYCLVQSKAYPSEEEMDDALRILVTSPKAALADLVDIDPEAADMLHFYLVGYACVRRFYNLRDEEINIAANKIQTKTINRPIMRRRLAAKALLAAISSAADSIYGGLYDAERQSAIQVDGLLTLLGEATVFLSVVGQKPVLTASQLYSLLAAVEDVQTVSSRVYDAADECLQASLWQYHGSQPPSPHAMLKKSMSSGTASNFSFSMMGSEMLAGSATSAGGKSVGSAVLVGTAKGKAKDGKDTERGWDWRARFKGKGSNGADVLRFLRVGIAHELSLAELDVE